jgi:hemerythrin
MNAIPRWSPSMSVRDPVLDAQHIELLELCRTVLELMQHDIYKGDLCIQRLEEISHVLREHDCLEASKLLARGEHLPDQLRINRAMAQQQLEELALTVSMHDMPQAKFQTLLCNWIQYHLH